MKTINIESVLDWAKGQDELRGTKSTVVAKALEEIAVIKAHFEQPTTERQFQTQSSNKDTQLYPLNTDSTAT